MKISPLIEAKELNAIFSNPDLMIFDASNGKDARLNYENEHLAGAYFIDLDTQLAAVIANPAQGGRHPLPSKENFASVLSDYGVTKDTHIIIYDDKNGSNAAARFWWMLKSAGHEKVQVLNGGLHHAKHYNFPMSSSEEVIVPASLPYYFEDWKLPTVKINDVEKAMQRKDHLIIDVRSKSRYDGITEPIDLIAGHIPGAVNVEFTENLDESGLFLDPLVLKEKYLEIIGQTKTENVIVHCGSGVTACHTLLAMAYADLAIPNLYVGSWSEWSRNSKPMETTH